MCVVMTTSSWPCECEITPEVDGISVWQHMHPCPRRHHDRPLASKVLCTTFYVEVESAVDSVVQDIRYPSYKYGCVCNIVPT